MSINTFNATIAASKGRDLIAAIADSGYTRGKSDRGRVVLTGADVIVVEYDSLRMTYTATCTFDTVAEAESYLAGPRGNAAALRRIAAENESIIERERLDSRY